MRTKWHFFLLGFLLILSGQAGAKAPSKKPHLLSPKEKKIVAEADAEFRRAKKRKAPTAHMRKKMQSGLSEK